MWRPGREPGGFGYPHVARTAPQGAVRVTSLVLIHSLAVCDAGRAPAPSCRTGVGNQFCGTAGLLAVARAAVCQCSAPSDPHATHTATPSWPRLSTRRVSRLPGENVGWPRGHAIFHGTSSGKLDTSQG